MTSCGFTYSRGGGVLSFKKEKYLLVVLLPGKAAHDPNVSHRAAALEEDKIPTIQYNYTTRLEGVRRK